jgi:polyhydroxybutyrate depolymerase
VLVIAAIVAAAGGFVGGLALLPGTGGVTAASARPASPSPGTAGPNGSTPAGGATSSNGVAAACPGLMPGPVGVLPGQKILAAGRPRTYLLSVPAETDPGRRIPVVFVWHGDGGDGRTIRQTLGLEEAAGGGAIFVYPDGVETPTGWWDLESHAAKNRDTALFDAILAQLGQGYCIDPGRVFSTGFSSGGFFTNHLACERGDRIKAIAPQSGGGPYWPDTAYNEDGELTCPTPPVAALVIHGNADPTVPNDSSKDNPDGGWQSFRHWAYWNHALPRGAYDFATDPLSPGPCRAARDLPAGHPVVACFIDGLGHEPWAQEASVVWSFFRSVP